MSKLDLESIIARIRDRKPYVDIYYKEFGYKPQWLKHEIDRKGSPRGSEYKEELVDFEEWLVSYRREERINKLLGE